MKKSYDFSNAVKNPYAKRLERPLTIKLDKETIGSFQNMGEDLTIPCKTLVNGNCQASDARPNDQVKANKRLS